jgi:hypothetical protein
MDARIARAQAEAGSAAAISAGPDETPALTISTQQWLAKDADLLDFDRAIHRFEDDGVPFRLCLDVDTFGNRDAIEQIVTRYQRLMPLQSSLSPVIHDVLRLHGTLFDKAKALVRADYDHALDTWRWLLRLDPHAGAALQIAALFHDIERVWSEGDVRVEHQAEDYASFKRRHAVTSAEKVVELLGALGLPQTMLREVQDLVRDHDIAGRSVDSASLLNDADALSFFSLNSWGYLMYFGEEHTTKKVRFTVARMSERALQELPRLRYHPTVKACLVQVMECER